MSGFDVVSRTVTNGDQLVVANAAWSADVFTENGGLPDTFLANVAFPGTMHFTYLGRDPAVNPLGTFTTIITDFDFQGAFGGNTLAITRDPGKISMGSTTILPAGIIPPVSFTVSSSIEVFGLFSFNGSPFMPGPPRAATLTPIPEPGFAVVAGLILAGLIGIASRRSLR